MERENSLKFYCPILGSWAIGTSLQNRQKLIWSWKLPLEKEKSGLDQSISLFETGWILWAAGFICSTSGFNPFKNEFDTTRHRWICEQNISVGFWLQIALNNPFHHVFSRGQIGIQMSFWKAIFFIAKGHSFEPGIWRSEVICHLAAIARDFCTMEAIGLLGRLIVWCRSFGDLITHLSMLFSKGLMKRFWLPTIHSDESSNSAIMNDFAASKKTARKNTLKWSRVFQNGRELKLGNSSVQEFQRHSLF